MPAQGGALLPPPFGGGGGGDSDQPPLSRPKLSLTAVSGQRGTKKDQQNPALRTNLSLLAPGQEVAAAAAAPSPAAVGTAARDAMRFLSPSTRAVPGSLEDALDSCDFDTNSAGPLAPWRIPATPKEFCF